jgi:anti-anti-sigma factor
MMPHRPAPLLHARKAGDVTHVTVLTHDLSEANAKVVGQALVHLVEGVARPRLRLDLARVRFLTSTLLGNLVALHKRVRATGGELVLLNVTGYVYEVFELTRLHEFLDVRRPPRAAASQGGPGTTAPPDRTNAAGGLRDECGRSTRQDHAGGVRARGGVTDRTSE